MTQRKLGVLIHGEWGSGKSWFGASAPSPRLLLSAEGQHQDIPGDKILWDPRTELPELPDSDNLSVVVNVVGYEEVRPVVQLLESGQHPFESVVVDSLHELQNQAKRVISSGGGVYNPDALFDQQSWGRLLNHLELLIRKLRDMTREDAKKPIHYVLICGTDDEQHPMKPMLQGGLRKSIGGIPNIVGYLRTYVDEGEVHRYLQTLGDTTAVAKNNVDAIAKKYPKGIKDPTFNTLLEAL